MKLNIHETARVLSVSEETLYRWVRAGKVPFSEIRQQLRFNRAELLQWATEQGLPIAVDLFPATGADGRAPSLATAIEFGGVHHKLPGDGRDAVLRAVVDVMRLPDGVDREALYQAMRAREDLGSTGIGDGIAIPHAHRPVVLDVPAASIALCFLAHPVDFGAIDGRRVTTVFSFVTPTSRAHLQLLSRLSAALADPGFREAVDKRALSSQILVEARRVEAAFAKSDPEGRMPFG